MSRKQTSTIYSLFHFAYYNELLTSQTTENRQRQFKLSKCKRAIKLYELIIRIVDIYYLVNGIRYITKRPQVYKAIFTCSSRRSFHSMWTSHDSIESYKDCVTTSQVCVTNLTMLQRHLVCSQDPELWADNLLPAQLHQRWALRYCSVKILRSNFSTLITLV